MTYHDAADEGRVVLRRVHKHVVEASVDECACLARFTLRLLRLERAEDCLEHGAE